MSELKPVEVEDSVWGDDEDCYILRIPDDVTIEQCCLLLTLIKCNKGPYSSSYVLELDGAICVTECTSIIDEKPLRAIFFQGIKANNQANQTLFDLHLLSLQ